MLDLKHFKGFAIVQGDSSVEARRIVSYCITNDIELIKIKKGVPCPPMYVPSGSVEWCLKSLSSEVIPDYYPEWLSNYLFRKVWKDDKWILGRKLFVKPSDKYKRFTGFVTTGCWSKKKKPPFYYSEIVNFKNEWRYYVTSGKIVCAELYWGDEINEPKAPELNIQIPENYSGALDFGELEDGRIALVESQHPFACGWYGDKEKDELYFQWLIDGWLYMTLVLPLRKFMQNLKPFKFISKI